MPNTGYRYYRWHKRVSDFPFTHAIALALLASALVFMMSLGPSPFDEGLGTVLLLFAIPAAVLILLGLQWKGATIVAYGIEQTGHWLAVGTWVLNVWILVSLGNHPNVATPIILAAAHVIRAGRLLQESNRIRNSLREAAQAETDRGGGLIGD